MKYLLPYFGVRFLSGCIRIMPLPMMSMLSQIVSVFLHSILRYRRKTALQNLANCFPDKTHAELKRMLPAVYLNLTDVFLETIKEFSLSPNGIMEYVAPPTDRQLDLYHAHFRGAILASAHLSNWEWCAYCLTEVLQGPGIAVYRPLKNPKVDEMMRRHREKSGMKIIPMRETVKILSRGASGSHFVLLAADQSPDPDSAHWEEFFGQKTAFFKGPATLARRYNLPVFFVYLERLRRHHYRMHIEPLCVHPLLHEAQDITQMYAQSLEHHIKKKPECWLWTHRRWKHIPPADI